MRVGNKQLLEIFFKKVVTATPFLPGKYIKRIKDLDKIKDEKIITISGSSHPNPISVDQIFKIGDILPKVKDKMGKNFDEIKFIVTGYIPEGTLNYLKKKINEYKNFYFFVDKEISLNFVKRESILDEVLNSEPYKSFNLLNEKNYESFFIHF